MLNTYRALPNTTEKFRKMIVGWKSITKHGAANIFNQKYRGWCYSVWIGSNNFLKTEIYSNKTLNRHFHFCCKCDKKNSVVLLYMPEICAWHCTFWTAITNSYHTVSLLEHCFSRTLGDVTTLHATQGTYRCIFTAMFLINLKIITVNSGSVKIKQPVFVAK